MESGAQRVSIEANRDLGRRFFAEQDRLRGGPSPELCAEDYRAALGSNPVFDRSGHEGFARAFYAAFPDVRHDIEDVVADERSASVRFILRGTHTGSFFGIPPTGKAIAIPAHAILRTDGRRVSELLAVFDEAGLLRQIGVLPSG